MKLIVLSHPKKQDEEIKYFVQLFESGLEFLHIRKPGFSKTALEKIISQIPAQYYNRIIIHSHYSLAQKYGLKGIHFTYHVFKKRIKSRLIFNYLRLLNPKMHISASFHRLSELQTDKRNYNYVFLSPVFKSFSKINYSATFSDYSLKMAMNNATCNVIALGGVDHSRVEKILELGFDGMAVLGSIWRSDKPMEEFIAIQNKIKQCCTTLASPAPTT